MGVSKSAGAAGRGHRCVGVSRARGGAGGGVQACAPTSATTSLRARSEAVALAAIISHTMVTELASADAYCAGGPWLSIGGGGGAARAPTAPALALEPARSRSRSLAPPAAASDIASMSSAAYWPSAPAPPLPASCVNMGTRLGSYCGLNLT